MRIASLLLLKGFLPVPYLWQRRETGDAKRET
jgi:hypothetical protein